MFKKLNLRIYVSLMLTVVMMLASISVPCLILLSNTLMNTYDSLSLQKLDRSISSCKNYVNSVLLTGQNLALDQEIITKLSANNDLVITNKLNIASEYALKINGITIYDIDEENIYTSSSVSDVPTLSKIRANQDLKDFFDLDNVEYVSLRTDNIPNTYDGALYDTALGMVSCCRKIFDGDTVVGYIFIDIFPSNLYEYFRYDTDLYFSETIPFISFGSNYFLYESNYKYRADLEQSIYSPVKSQDNKYLIIPSNRNFYGGLVKIAVPLSSYRATLRTVAIVLFAACAFIIIGVHFIARAVASRVNNRLLHLYKKMETQNLDL